MKNDYIFCAVCQSGVFELKALILASSFFQHDKTRSKFVFGVPDGELNPITLEFIKKMKIQTVAIDTPIEGYPISNKLALFKAVCATYPAHHHIFMDSDMIWLQAFDGIPNVDKADIWLRSGGAKSTQFYDTAEDWAPVYNLFNDKPPSHRINAFESSKQILPYFNAGFICTSKGEEFSRTWLEVAKKIDSSPHIKHKRPWLDQLALPVTCQLNAMEIGLLDHQFNAPFRLGAKYDNWRVNHYSLLSSLTQQKAISALLRKSLNLIPNLEKLVKELLEQEQERKRSANKFSLSRAAGENPAARIEKNMLELQAISAFVKDA